MERFLKKIGVENIQRFDGCYFSELVSEKKVNRLIVEISCPSLLNYDDYKDLFQQIYKMAENPKGFETRLSFKYQNEDKNLHNFLNSWQNDGASSIETYFDYNPKEKLIVTEYNPETEMIIKEDVIKLNNFLSKINCSIKAVAKQSCDDFFDEQIPLENEEPPINEDEYEEEEKSSNKPIIQKITSQSL